jgi:hypothetical protein
MEKRKKKTLCPLHTSLQATLHSKHWSLKEYYFECYGNRVSLSLFPSIFFFFFTIYHFSPIILLFRTFSLCCLSALQTDGCFRLRQPPHCDLFSTSTPPLAPFICIQAKGRLAECVGAAED